MRNSLPLPSGRVIGRTLPGPSARPTPIFPRPALLRPLALKRFNTIYYRLIHIIYWKGLKLSEISQRRVWSAGPPDSPPAPRTRRRAATYPEPPQSGIPPRPPPTFLPETRMPHRPDPTRHPLQHPLYPAPPANHARILAISLPPGDPRTAGASGASGGSHLSRQQLYRQPLDAEAPRGIQSRQPRSDRRSRRPGRAPVWSPPSMTTSPLTRTCDTPAAYWWGWS